MKIVFAILLAILEKLSQPKLEIRQKVLAVFEDGLEKRSPALATGLNMPLATFHRHARDLCKEGLLQKFELTRQHDVYGDVTRITHKITPKGSDFLKNSRTKVRPEITDSGGANKVAIA